MLFICLTGMLSAAIGNAAPRTISVLTESSVTVSHMTKIMCQYCWQYQNYCFSTTFLFQGMPLGFLFAVKEITDYFQPLIDFKIKAVRHHQRNKTFMLYAYQAHATSQRRHWLSASLQPEHKPMVYLLQSGSLFYLWKARFYRVNVVIAQHVPCGEFEYPFCLIEYCINSFDHRAKRLISCFID